MKKAIIYFIYFLILVAGVQAMNASGIEQWLPCLVDFSDSTPNARDGALQNGAGIVNQRCNFDGANDYGDTNYRLNQNMNTDYSFSFWVNTTGAVLDGDRAMAILDQDGGQNYQIQFGYQTVSSSWEIYIGDGDIGAQLQGWRDTSAAQNPFNGVPHHVVIAVNDGVPSIYINGTLDATATQTFAGIPTAAIINKDYCLAARCLDASQDSQMPALIWEYVVYNYTLESTDVTALYNNGLRFTYEDVGASSANYTFNLSYVEQWLAGSIDYSDSTPNNRDSTALNGASIVNQRFKMDGTNDYIDTNYRLNQNMNTDYSFSLWVNSTGGLSDGDVAFGVLDQDAGQNYGILFGYQTGTSSWFMQIGDSDIGANLVYYVDSSAAQNPFNGSSNHVVVTVASGKPKIYINGVEDGSVTKTLDGVPTAATINKDYCLGLRCLDASQDSAMPVMIWEYAVYNKTLSTKDVTTLYGAGSRVTYQDLEVNGISFLDPTPPNNAVNNTYNGVNITIYSQNDNIKAYFGNILVGNGSETSPFTYSLNSTLVPTDGNYTYNATNGYNSISQLWIYDATKPTITLSNASTFYNNITSNPYNGILLFNLNVSDSRDLYGFEALAKLGATVYFNYTLLNLTSTTRYAFINQTNFTQLGFPYGTYSISVTFSDSHTDEEIKSYSTAKLTNGIRFDTTEKNIISINSQDTATFTAVKKIDRYQFEYKSTVKGIADRIFTLKSDKPISYLSKSKYVGHFVVWNSATKSGNWIDFEGLGKSPIVEKVTDYEYKVTFKDSLDTITFNSIGGLNVVSQDYIFEYGNLTLNKAVLYPQTPINSSDISAYLNVTNSLGDNINYSYSWYINNNIVLSGELLNRNSAQEYLISTLPNAYTDVGDNVTFSFNASTSKQGYISQTNLSVNVTNWAIDLCSFYTTGAFNLTIKDETTDSLLVANSTTNINGYSYPSITDSQYFTLNALDNSTLNFCKNPQNLTVNANVNVLLSKFGYYTTTFYLYDAFLSGTYKAYMLQQSATTQQVVYTIKGSDGNVLAGTEFKVYRVINGTNFLIHDVFSNVAGQIAIYQDSLITYSYELSKDSYADYSFSLQPTATTYTLTMTPTTQSYYTNPYQGIRYRVTPSGNLFLANKNYTNFTFRVEGTGFSAIGMNLSYHNYTCLPASCAVHLVTSTDAEVSVLINISNYGTINSAYYFVIDGERIYINDDILKAYGFNYTTNSSIVQLMAYVKSVTTANERALFFAFIEVSALGIGAMFGIVGSLALLIASGLILFASLPNIGLINPLAGIIFTVFGLALYFKFQAEREH